jgi:hypothetical protein
LSSGKPELILILVFFAVALSSVGILLLQAVYNDNLPLEFLGSSTVRDLIFAYSLVNIGVVLGLTIYLMWYPPPRRLALYSFYSLFGLFRVGIASSLLPQLSNFNFELADGVKGSTSFLANFSSPIACFFCAAGAWYSYGQYRDLSQNPKSNNQRAN